MINYEVFASVSTEPEDEGAFLGVPSSDVLMASVHLLISQGWSRVRLTSNSGQILADGCENEDTGEVDWRVDPRRNDGVREN